MRILLPTVIVIPALLVLVGLGLWQVDRLAWKEDLIATIEERLAAAPQPLPQDLEDYAHHAFRPYAVRGELDTSRSLLQDARVFEGQSGKAVISVLTLEDGRVFLLDRGWIPHRLSLEELDKGRGQAEPSAYIVTLRQSGWQGSALFKPANDPARGSWVYIDLPDMARALDVTPSEQGLYLQVIDQQGEGLPRVQKPGATLTNNHLQYAVTWFALAFVLLVIYILYLREARSSKGP